MFSVGFIAFVIYPGDRRDTIRAVTGRGLRTALSAIDGTGGAVWPSDDHKFMCVTKWGSAKERKG